MLVGTEQGITSVSLNVSEVTLPVGASITAIATVETTGFAPKTLLYTSSDTEVATVDAFGTITAVAAGTATITATSKFDTTKSATVDVTVT